MASHKQTTPGDPLRDTRPAASEGFPRLDPDAVRIRTLRWRPFLSNLLRSFSSVIPVSTWYTREVMARVHEETSDARLKEMTAEYLERTALHMELHGQWNELVGNDAHDEYVFHVNDDLHRFFASYLNDPTVAMPHRVYGLVLAGSISRVMCLWVEKLVGKMGPEERRLWTWQVRDESGFRQSGLWLRLRAAYPGVGIFARWMNIWGCTYFWWTTFVRALYYSVRDRSIFNPLFAIDLCRFIISPRKGLPRLLYWLLTAKADS